MLTHEIDPIDRLVRFHIDFVIDISCFKYLESTLLTHLANELPKISGQVNKSKDQFGWAVVIKDDRV